MKDLSGEQKNQQKLFGWLKTGSVTFNVERRKPTLDSTILRYRSSPVDFSSMKRLESWEECEIMSNRLPRYALISFFAFWEISHPTTPPMGLPSSCLVTATAKLLDFDSPKKHSQSACKSDYMFCFPKPLIHVNIGHGFLPKKSMESHIQLSLVDGIVHIDGAGTRFNGL